jgi:hypothetical protein
MSGTFNSQDYVPNLPSNDAKIDAGPYLGRVVGHFEPNYMGVLEVQLIKPTGNDSSTGQTVKARMLTPFFGSTGDQFIRDTVNDYNNTQKSYGMWMIPPDVGAIVMVIYVNGDSSQPFWIGCVPPEDANFMVPGIAATEYTVDGGDFQDASGRAGRVPVAEYNKVVNGKEISDATKVTKPKHPFTSILSNQGLLLDDIRGITTSSSRREIPSMVFGISTPGPIDKQPNAQRGEIGKADSPAQNVPVSRLGGTTFVMDDGDDKFIRKTAANAGPPIYESIEGLADNTTPSGNVTIPHNELVRIRTRTGHQILMHNSEDLIYIGNASGTTWIELTSNGKIDIYAKDSISVHTEADMNFYADRDINMEAKRNINMKATGNVQVESGKNTTLMVGQNGFITTTAAFNINSANNFFTATGTTHIKSTTQYNSGTAAYSHFVTGGTADATAAGKGVKLTTHTNPGITVASILKRIPAHEPYAHHENLDPTAFTPAKTDRDVAGNLATPKAFNNYSTSVDTFRKGT